MPHRYVVSILSISQTIGSPHAQILVYPILLIWLLSIISSKIWGANLSLKLLTNMHMPIQLSLYSGDGFDHVIDGQNELIKLLLRCGIPNQS